MTSIPGAFSDLPLDEEQVPTLLTTDSFQDMLQQCIHCGLCLQACPTYSVFGTETDSPRGRIDLMRAAAQGRISLDGAFEQHIDLCLGCRACETACPSGVKYGALVETARTVLEQEATPGPDERFIRWLSLKQLLPHLGRLRWMARLLRIYQWSGLPRLVRGLNLLHGPLRVMEGMLPPLHTRFRDYSKPAPALGEKRGVVAFFYGCIQEAFLSPVNEATIRVLQRNGYEVIFPQQQTCCGAAAQHMGDRAQAVFQARRNIDAFLEAGEQVAAIINNAGGCGAALKEYPHLLEHDPDYAAKARRFAAKVMDISEFLADNLHNPPQGAVPGRVVYSDSCHLRHAQGVVRQPRELLRQIPGLELVELERPERCCGSAGVYNLVQWESGQAILEEKMQDIERSGADTIVATNTGCYLQLVYGAQQSARHPRVVHLVELLDASYQAGEAAGQLAGQPDGTAGER